MITSTGHSKNYITVGQYQVFIIINLLISMNIAYLYSIHKAIINVLAEIIIKKNRATFYRVIMSTIHTCRAI